MCGLRRKVMPRSDYSGTQALIASLSTDGSVASGHQAVRFISDFASLRLYLTAINHK